jgi:hypothetical protein
LGQAEVGLLQLGTSEIGPPQVGPVEASPLQLGLLELDPSQLDSPFGEGTALLRSVQASKVGPGQISPEMIKASFVLGCQPLLVFLQDDLHLLIRNFPQFGFGGGRL